MIGRSGLCSQVLAIWQHCAGKLIPFDSLRKCLLTMIAETLRKLNPSSYALKTSLRKDIQGGSYEIQPNPFLVDGRRSWLGL